MWSSSEHQKPRTKNKKFTNSSAAFADSVTPRRRSSDKDRNLRLKFQNMTAVFWVLLKHLVSHRQHILQWAPRLSQPVSWERIVYLIFCVFHLTSMCMESGSPSSKDQEKKCVTIYFKFTSLQGTRQVKHRQKSQGGTGEFGQISTLRVEGICLETECFLPWYMHVLCGSMTGACSEISPDQPCPRNLWIRNKINHPRWFIFTNDSLTTTVKFVLGWILDRCSLWGDSGVSYSV